MPYPFPVPRTGLLAQALYKEDCDSDSDNADPAVRLQALWFDFTRLTPHAACKKIRAFPTPGKLLPPAPVPPLPPLFFPCAALRQLVLYGNADVMMSVVHPVTDVKGPLLIHFIRAGMGEAALTCLEAPGTVDFSSGRLTVPAERCCGQQPNTASSSSLAVETERGSDARTTPATSSGHGYTVLHAIASANTGSDAFNKEMLSALVDHFPRHPQDRIDWWATEPLKHLDFLSLAAEHQLLSTLWPIVKDWITPPPSTSNASASSENSTSIAPVGVASRASSSPSFPRIPLRGEVWAWDWAAMGPVEQQRFDLRTATHYHHCVEDDVVEEGEAENTGAKQTTANNGTPPPSDLSSPRALPAPQQAARPVNRATGRLWKLVSQSLLTLMAPDDHHAAILAKEAEELEEARLFGIRRCVQMEKAVVLYPACTAEPQVRRILSFAIRYRSPDVVRELLETPRWIAFDLDDAYSVSVSSSNSTVDDEERKKNGSLVFERPILHHICAGGKSASHVAALLHCILDRLERRADPNSHTLLFTETLCDTASHSAQKPSGRQARNPLSCAAASQSAPSHASAPSTSSLLSKRIGAHQKEIKAKNSPLNLFSKTPSQTETKEADAVKCEWDTIHWGRRNYLEDEPISTAAFYGHLSTWTRVLFHERPIVPYYVQRHSSDERDGADGGRIEITEPVKSSDWEQLPIADQNRFWIAVRVEEKH